MKKHVLSAALAAALAFPAIAQEEAKPSHPGPNEIVEKAEAKDWVVIASEDLLVMDLAPDRDGKARRVVIQLMPAPFSQGWVRNIRKLASAHWYDGIAIVRVQDNYVTQWGDPDGENAAKAKKLPEGLEVVPESEYFANMVFVESGGGSGLPLGVQKTMLGRDFYSQNSAFWAGWPIGISTETKSSFRSYSRSGVRRIPIREARTDRFWPVHCYGMVGVGRSYSPDTGTGAELYTVIGHAPRHLDRNIALVGRIIEGMEHMSSLPRGTGPLGFYEDPAQRVPIQSVRLASEMEERPAMQFEYLSTESETFARYADARANRRDPFFIKPAGGADICNIPVPVRRKK